MTRCQAEAGTEDPKAHPGAGGTRSSALYFVSGRGRKKGAGTRRRLAPPPGIPAVFRALGSGPRCFFPGATYLVQVIKDLQQGEQAGPDEQAHLAPNVPCKGKAGAVKSAGALPWAPAALTLLPTFRGHPSIQRSPPIFRAPGIGSAETGFPVDWRARGFFCAARIPRTGLCLSVWTGSWCAAARSSGIGDPCINAPVSAPAFWTWGGGGQGRAEPRPQFPRRLPMCGM